MRITGGNVGIGTASPGTALQVDASKSNTTVSAPFNSDILRLNNTNATTNALHGILMTRTNGASLTSVGAIMSQVTTQTVGSAAADLLFYTATSDVISERMRITSGGSVLVGMTTGTAKLNITQSGVEWATYYNHTNSTQYFELFQYNGSTVGSIIGYSTSTSYNTTSDYRLKQDFKDFNGLELLSKIKTYDYEWKLNKTRSYGVIAHELQSVINYAVTGVKDGKEMQGVDYSKIVPVLIKAVQEQQAQINDLKSQLNK
jgi:hypothetical protein